MEHVLRQSHAEVAACSTDIREGTALLCSLLEAHYRSDAADTAACAKWHAQGNRAYANKEFGNAVGCFTRALTACCSQHQRVVLLTNRSAALLSIHHREAAVNDSLAAVFANPLYSKAWFRLYEAARKHGTDFSPPLLDEIVAVMNLLVNSSSSEINDKAVNLAAVLATRTLSSTAETIYINPRVHLEGSDSLGLIVRCANADDAVHPADVLLREPPFAAVSLCTTSVLECNDIGVGGIGDVPRCSWCLSVLPSLTIASAATSSVCNYGIPCVQGCERRAPTTAFTVDTTIDSTPSATTSTTAAKRLCRNSPSGCGSQWCSAACLLRSTMSGDHDEECVASLRSSASFSESAHPAFAYSLLPIEVVLALRMMRRHRAAAAVYTASQEDIAAAAPVATSYADQCTGDCMSAAATAPISVTETADTFTEGCVSGTQSITAICSYCVRKSLSSPSTSRIVAMLQSHEGDMPPDRLRQLTVTGHVVANLFQFLSSMASRRCEAHAFTDGDARSGRAATTAPAPAIDSSPPLHVNAALLHLLQNTALGKSNFLGTFDDTALGKPSPLSSAELGASIAESRPYGTSLGGIDTSLGAIDKSAAVVPVDLIRTLAQIACNAHSIKGRGAPDRGEGINTGAPAAAAATTIGMAVYAVGSIANHSCVPTGYTRFAAESSSSHRHSSNSNTITPQCTAESASHGHHHSNSTITPRCAADRESHGHSHSNSTSTLTWFTSRPPGSTLEIVALARLREHQPLTISYGPALVTMQGTEQRRAALAHRFYFECECPWCAYCSGSSSNSSSGDARGNDGDDAHCSSGHARDDYAARLHDKDCDDSVVSRILQRAAERSEHTLDSSSSAAVAAREMALSLRGCSIAIEMATRFAIRQHRGPWSVHLEPLSSSQSQRAIDTIQCVDKLRHPHTLVEEKGFLSCCRHTLYCASSAPSPHSQSPDESRSVTADAALVVIPALYPRYCELRGLLRRLVGAGDAAAADMLSRCEADIRVLQSVLLI